MSGPPSGWLEDPDDPQRLRWWDGSQWTEHRRPLEGETAAPSPGGTSTATADPDTGDAGRSGPSGGDRGAVTTRSSHAAEAPAAVGDLNALAVGSLAVALIWAGGLGSIAAIAMGVVARRQISESASGQRGDGLALAGIVVGVLGIIVPLLLLAGLSSTGSQDLPADSTGRASGTEVEEALRALHEAQESFHEENGRYATEEELSDRTAGDIDGAVVFVVGTRGDGFCVEAFPAAGGRPQRVTDEDSSPRSSGC